MNHSTSDVEVHRLCADVAAQLWAVYHERDDAPLLILPAKRDGSRRVSEQESKILITQWLQAHGHPYSIETPTAEAYRQSGQAEMSARLDITVYGTRNHGDRVLNMELKAGTNSLENYRKDFEKLLREGVEGLWFQTVEAASTGAWASISQKMTEAFDRLPDEVATAGHSIHFALCVLHPPQLLEFDLDFSRDWRASLRDAFEFSHNATVIKPDWQPSPRSQRRVPDTVARSYSDGGQRKLLVYIPSLEPESFIHLSTKGSSYRLRSFGGSRGLASWRVPGCNTIDELLAKHPIIHQEDAKADRASVDGEVQHWIARIAAANARHGVGV